MTTLTEMADEHRERARHTCHAKGCDAEVPPEMLMCRRHWRMVPRRIQRRVAAYYRHGQCFDRRPSRDWCEAAREAVEHVKTTEGV